ncbi:mobile mystery protein A [soil metagenome]
MDKKRLQVQQLNSKMQSFQTLQKLPVPPIGWIRAVRSALGISLQQLAAKMNSSKQNIAMLERREKEGTISLKTLRDAANALNMDLVYGFVPKDGSLEKLIDRKAEELAKKVVLRTSNTMKLENQQNSDERIQKAIEERTTSFKNELPKILWD